MFVIYTLEYLVDLLLGHLQLIEGGPDCLKFKIAWVVSIKSLEGISKLFEIESSVVDWFDKEI